MSEMPTSGVNRVASPPPPPPVGSSFFEPIGQNWLTRTGSQPVGEWMRQLPHTEIGLSTLDRWLGPIDPQATVAQIETEMRGAMGIEMSRFPTTVEMVQSEFNDIKLGHGMGSLAADLRQRIADYPSLASPSAARLLETLDRRATALSQGAAAQATANPNDFSYNGTCYHNADAMARAVIQYQSTQPQMREYTPEMALQAEYAALDRQMWNSHQPGIGYPWSATAYQFARANGATPDQLRRATAGGQLLDIGLGIGGAVGGTTAARNGFTPPGGQPSYRPSTVGGAPLEPQSLRLGAQPVVTPPRLNPVAPVGGGIAVSNGSIFNGLTGPGPLGAQVAATFRGGTYTQTVTNEPTTLYRVYGGNARELGPYWTRTMPTGPVQSIVDTALNPAWGNNATRVVQITVPPGTTLYEGAAAPQGGLVGGGNQVFVPNINPAWVVR